MDYKRLQQALDRDLCDELPWFELSRATDFTRLDPKHCAANRLSTSLLKKNAFCRAANAGEIAIKKWVDCNSNCAMTFDLYPEDLEVRQVLFVAREFLFNLLCVRTMGPGYGDLKGFVRSSDGQFGPGKTLMCEDETFYAKTHNSPHTYTHPYLVDFFKSAVAMDKSWPLVENEREAKFGFTRVTSSKLITVPKSNETDRTICIEPKLNMFFQQAIRKLLERRLKDINIDLANQQNVQRKLALEGSISGDLATVDLSSASDTISIGLCKALLPKPLMELLTIARCPETILPSGEVVKLRMISSMGNATTFPLQTLIFYSLAYASMRVLHIHCKQRGKGRNIGVNGDDIILPVHATSLLFKVLSYCGFKVNTAKTYHEWFFRESCGGDYSAGVDVCPVYLKDALDNDPALFSAINRLMQWGARHNILLLRTVALLRASVKRVCFVPLYMPIDSGILTRFSAPVKFHYYAPVVNRRTVDGLPSLFFVLGTRVEQEIKYKKDDISNEASPLDQDEQDFSFPTRKTYGPTHQRRRARAVVLHESPQRVNDAPGSGHGSVSSRLHVLFPSLPRVLSTIDSDLVDRYELFLPVYAFPGN